MRISGMSGLCAMVRYVIPSFSIKAERRKFAAAASILLRERDKQDNEMLVLRCANTWTSSILFSESHSWVRELQCWRRSPITEISEILHPPRNNFSIVLLWAREPNTEMSMMGLLFK